MIMMMIMIIIIIRRKKAVAGRHAALTISVCVCVRIFELLV